MNFIKKPQGVEHPKRISVMSNGMPRINDKGNSLPISNADTLNNSYTNILGPEPDKPRKESIFYNLQGEQLGQLNQ